DDEPRARRALQPRDAGEDEARLLAARDHLDGQAQRTLRTREEGVAVARLAQRLRGDGAHLVRRAAAQALGEAGQAGEAPLGRGVFQHAAVVEPGAQPHGLLEVVDAAVLAALELADLEAK